MATLEERLLARVEPDTNGWGCWLWTGALQSAGYGHLWVEGRTELAHREAHLLWVGPLPPDRPHACHRCDTPACIRPDHLFACTQVENVADMDTKERADRYGRAKLQSIDIPLIRARLATGEPRASIAVDYDVSPNAIGDIDRGRTWRHVK